MKITVCIGSSCHLKGSRQVVESLQALIAENQLTDKVEMTGAFCMGNCQKGVCVNWKDKIYSLDEDNVEAFFRENVLTEF